MKYEISSFKHLNQNYPETYYQILGDCVLTYIILILISYHSKNLTLIITICLNKSFSFAFIYTISIWILTNLVSNLPFHIQLRLYHALLIEEELRGESFHFWAQNCTPFLANYRNEIVNMAFSKNCTHFNKYLIF